MTPDPNPYSTPEGEHDPVAAFFDDARAQVREEPASDLDWQRIVDASRRTSHRRNRLAMLSSAAVAVIAVFAVFLWQQNGIDNGVQRGEVIAGATDEARTGGPTASPSSVSPQQQPTKVPDSFRTWSVSYAGQSTIYALGQQDCGGDKCPVLLRSNTNGKSWNAVHKFTGTDVSAATGTTDVANIQPQRAVTQVRFATPSVGYVFGGDLWITRDSGGTFTKMSHPGDTVLDVEINQKQAVLLSANNCAQGICNGPVYVSRFDVSASGVSGTTAQVTPSSSIRTGNISVQSGNVIVQLTASDSDKSIAPMRLDDDKLTSLKAPSVCAGSNLQAVTPVTNVSTELDLFGLCDPQRSGADHTAYTIVRSSDAGRSWQKVARGTLILPRLGQVWLAAADSNHLVASAGGPRETGGVPAPNGDDSLMVSDNGGQGFAAVKAPKGSELPATGFDWVASAGGPYFFAVPRTTHGFWMTTSFDGPWTVVDPRH
ncbi:hypothetical protein [Flexivirga sp. B27]